VAANLTGREGYPVPYYERLGFNQRAGIPGFTRVQVVDEDQFRLDDIHVIDARLEKEFSFSDFGPVPQTSWLRPRILPPKCCRRGSFASARASRSARAQRPVAFL
jgi:hypothetical protein